MFIVFYLFFPKKNNNNNMNIYCFVVVNESPGNSLGVYFYYLFLVRFSQAKAVLSLYCVLTEIKVQVHELNVDVVAAVVFLLHSVECVGLGQK